MEEKTIKLILSITFCIILVIVAFIPWFFGSKTMIDNNKFLYIAGATLLVTGFLVAILKMIAITYLDILNVSNTELKISSIALSLSGVTIIIFALILNILQNVATAT